MKCGGVTHGLLSFLRPVGISSLKLWRGNWRGKKKTRRRERKIQARMLHGWNDAFLGCLWKIKRNSWNISSISDYNLYQTRWAIPQFDVSKDTWGAAHEENKSFASYGPGTSLCTEVRRLCAPSGSQVCTCRPLPARSLPAGTGNTAGRLQQELPASRDLSGTAASVRQIFKSNILMF